MPNDETTLPEEQPEPKTQEELKGSDPLDEITDTEELRNEAKKFRAISKRKSEPKKEEPKPKPNPEPKNDEDVVKKSDLARIATQEAKEMVGEEIAEVWDDLLNIPLGGFDPLNPKSIAANLKERFAILKSRTKPKEQKADTTAITSTKVIQGTGGASTLEKNLKIKANNKPENWYKKAE